MTPNLAAKALEADKNDGENNMPNAESDADTTAHAATPNLAAKASEPDKNDGENNMPNAESDAGTTVHPVSPNSADKSDSDNNITATFSTGLLLSEAIVDDKNREKVVNEAQEHRGDLLSNKTKVMPTEDTAPASTAVPTDIYQLHVCFCCLFVHCAL